MAHLLQSLLFFIFFSSLDLNFVVVDGQLGLLCSKDSDCKMSSSFTCGPSKSCVCQRGYRFDLLKLGCQKYLVSHGGKCDPIRDVCSGGSNSICIVNFLGERAVCQCKQGYLWDDKTQLCQTKEFITSNNQQQSGSTGSGGLQEEEEGVSPGGTCVTNKDCRGFPNATCYSYVTSGKRQCDCSFDSHYYDPQVKKCVGKKSYGSSCENVEQCVNLMNIECSSGGGIPTSNGKPGLCTCKINYYYDKKKGQCIPGMDIGDSCVHDQQCKARPHSYCTGQGNKGQLRCSCLPGKEYYDAAGTCVDMSGKIKPGQPCKTSDQCLGGVNAVCQSVFLGTGPVCKCKDGHIFDQGSSTCSREGDRPALNPSQGNNDSPGSPNPPVSTGPSSGSQNINLNLKFDIMIKVTCNPEGQCKTVNSTILQLQR